ncbi:hypothetical protein [Streptomyces sp. cg36]|uniref:hypothetical protein n=1 Tax=Streptomyces sp. cg36 TaxID=3238798 RepID=UPI0034E2EBB0
MTSSIPTVRGDVCGCTVTVLPTAEYRSTPTPTRVLRAQVGADEQRVRFYLWRLLGVGGAR